MIKTKIEDYTLSELEEQIEKAKTVIEEMKLKLKNKEVWIEHWETEISIYKIAIDAMELELEIKKRGKMKPLNFNEDQVTSYLRYTSQTYTHAMNALEFSFSTLKQEGFYAKIEEEKEIVFESYNWRKGKSYNFIALEYKGIETIIRHYQNHFTFFVLFQEKRKYFEVFGSHYFTFHSDIDKLEGEITSDDYVDDNFIDLKEFFKPIMESIKNDVAYLLNNSYSLKIPPHSEIKLAKISDSIRSIDHYVYCMEELSFLHHELVSEFFVQKALRSWVKNGIYLHKATIKSSLGGGPKKILEIRIPENDLHKVGILFENEGREEFEDIYSISRYYIEGFIELNKQIVKGLNEHS